MMDPREDEKLLQAARRGDAQALESLVEQHFGAVYAIAYSRLGHRETAEDLAQEVFLRAVLYLDQLKDTARFAGWLSQIVHNLANDWLKRGQRASRLVPMVPLDEVQQEIADPKGTNPRQQLNRKEEDQTVRDAIFRLPEDQREIILLHYIEGLNQKEIAERLEMHPSKVNRELKRALAAMKGSLEPALRESAPMLRASRQTAVRTASLAAAAIALPAASKAAIVSAAGGASWAAGLSAAASGAGSAAGSSGFLKTIMTHTATGGKLMAISKGVAIAVAGISLVVGGVYAVNHHNRSGATDEAPAAIVAVQTTPAPSAIAPTPAPAQPAPDQQQTTEPAAAPQTDSVASQPVATEGENLMKITPAQPKTDAEKEVLAILNSIQKDIKDENYAHLGTYGCNTFLSWGGVDGPKKIKDHVTVCLMDNMIDEVDYVAQGVPAKFTSIGDAAIDMQLTEPWRGTTCHLKFWKKDGKWVITDINQLSGMGQYIKPAVDEPIRAALDTTKMTKEEIIRGLYQALVEKDADKAVGYIQCSNPQMKLQWRNILRPLLREVPVLDTREVTMTGENSATVRFGVGHGFPGGGCAKKPDERQSKLIFVQSSNGLKIDGMRSFLGDSPADYR